MDTPINCSPSLHVGISYLLAFAFLDDLEGYFPFVLIWATLVSLSTLTTKQHYAIDVVSGTVLAGLVFYVFNRVLVFRIKK